MLGLAERGFMPQHIIDVGAHRARWSAKARLVFPSCDFTLVEPQVEMRPHLDAFCEGRRNAQWINAGVGSEMGDNALTVCPDSSTSNFVTTELQARSLGYEQRVVPMVTLDHLVGKVIKTMPDMVKIDAEGFEAEIMRGAQSLVGNTEIFLLEAHFFGPPDHPNRITNQAEMMAQLGYAPYDFTHFMKRPGDGAIGLCEVAFARENGILRT
jgi:FkbM family methyltransferase